MKRGGIEKATLAAMLKTGFTGLFSGFFGSHTSSRMVNKYGGQKTKIVFF